MTLGLICDACDALSPVSATACQRCGEPLGILSSRPSVRLETISDDAGAPVGQTIAATLRAAAPLPVTVGADSSPASPRAAARAPAAIATTATLASPPLVHCSTCGTLMPSTHRFCGSCGGRIEAPQPVGKTRYFGTMQEPGRARLVLIRSEGLDGITYQLSASEHVAGRREGEILFPDDGLLSPRHASFFYRGKDLHVRDEDSRNGVFVRIRAPYDLEEGQGFLVGEQLLSAVSVSVDPMLPDADGTLFYASPRRPARLKLVQLLSGGDVGLVYRARSETVTLGREGNDVNFPDDPFISGRHAQVTALLDGRFRLVDASSKNGTFVRIRDEARLSQGDYVFMGQQLLRVEIT